jgi:hypothetical protein
MCWAAAAEPTIGTSSRSLLPADDQPFRENVAKLEYRDGDGRAVSISVSLRGLAASVSALRTAERG